MQWSRISMVLLALATIANGNDIRIVSFTQSAESVTSGEAMVFNCRANADEAEWRVDGFPKFVSEPQNGFTISNTYDRNANPKWNLMLTMQGDSSNGRRISCYAASSLYIGHSIIQHKYFRVASAPVLPEVYVSVLQNGTNLSVTWDEPFYYSNYPVTGYKLEMENLTSGIVTTLFDGTDALSHVISVGEMVSGCHLLNFTVTAYSILGNATSHQLGIFPKAPTPTELTVELTFASDLTPRLTIRAEYEDPCLHEDTEYTIIVYHHGEIMAEKLVGNIQEQFMLDLLVDQGLEVGETYMVVATGNSILGSYTVIKDERIVVGDSCNADLPSLPNGIVQVSNTQYGLVAIYRCDDTSLPLVTRNCLSNSSWSGMAPFCPSINCNRDLPIPPNGRVNITTIPTGLVATYACNDDTVVTRTCLPNTSWSGEAPECRSIKCDRGLLDPPNGHVQITEASSGLVALYTCNDGIVWNRVCLPTASWSSPIPVCNEPGASSDSTTSIIASLAVFLGIVLGIVVMVIVIVAACCVYKRRRKFTQRTDTVDFPRRAPPTSIKLMNPLTQQKSATNPIYDGGPLYDYPMDPSLSKSLLHSTPSTPSTPSAQSPRYFNMPPQLPPPRKTSISISSPFSPTACSPLARTSISVPFSPTSCAAPQRISISSPFSPTTCNPPTPSTCQIENINAMFNAAVPPSEDAYMYTVMNPVTPKSLSRPNKPSPLILGPSLDTHDEYVSIL
ncbi:uncharacterized protein LOC135352413 isoform X3 [Halichondria panicea]